MAAADTSSENAKKIKDQFRSKVSQASLESIGSLFYLAFTCGCALQIAKHIVTCLGPYRKPDCKLGRIVSTDDFKHLARKVVILSSPSV